MNLFKKTVQLQLQHAIHTYSLFGDEHVFNFCIQFHADILTKLLNCSKKMEMIS